MELAGEAQRLTGGTNLSVLGTLAAAYAEAGRFADAMGFWKKAREIDPAYPNLDQLIAEAEKRK